MNDGVAAFVAARAARPLPFAVPADARPQTAAEGYALQRRVHDAIVAGGRRRTGFKVACTTAATQAAMGTTGPAYGGMFDDTFAPSLDAALARCPTRFALECEIAVRIGGDVDPGQPWTAATIGDRISSCAIAAEIVHNRYGDLLQTGLPTLIAADFLHAAYALGDWRPLADAGPLDALRARMWIDGTLVAEDVASTVMGHPLASVAWLAGALAAAGLRLRTGDVVLTGAIVPPRWLDRAPLAARIEVDRLGHLASGGGR